jgi:hypothetical protein
MDIKIIILLIYCLFLYGKNSTSKFKYYYLAIATNFWTKSNQYFKIIKMPLLIIISMNGC